MERAGAGLARASSTSSRPTGPIAVVCGKGNNGGDGLVAARLLREPDATCACCCSATRDELRGDARDQPRAAAGRAAARRSTPGALDGAAAIVDAILGTGFAGEPREPAAGAIEAINAAPATAARSWSPATFPAASTPRPARSPAPAVRADATVTFHAAKPGLWIAPARRTPGEVSVDRHRDPARAPRSSPDVGLIATRVTRRDPAPRPPTRPSSPPAACSSAAARPG